MKHKNWMKLGSAVPSKGTRKSKSFWYQAAWGAPGSWIPKIKISKRVVKHERGSGVWPPPNSKENPRLSKIESYKAVVSRKDLDDS